MRFAGSAEQTEEQVTMLRRVSVKRRGRMVSASVLLLGLASGCKEQSGPSESEQPAVPSAMPEAKPEAKAETKSVVLGQPAAFTGPSAGLGIEMWRGARAAFTEYNARPTTKVAVELLVADDGYDADKAAGAVRKLAEDPQLFALFGGVGTPTMVKALPVVEEFNKKNGLFYFANFTGAQVQREPPYDKFVFNVRASYRDETKALVNYFSERGYQKIGVFIQDDPYGASGKDGVSKALSANGRNITAEAKYPRGQTYETSTDPQLKALRDGKVDAIIAVGAYQACAALIRDARKQGWNVPVANLSFVGSDQLLDYLLAEEKKSGTPLTVNVINSQVFPSYNDLDSLVVAQYRTAMDKYKPTKPDIADAAYKSERPYSFGSLEGYVSARMFIAVLEAIKGPITRENFVKTAESMGAFNVGLNVESQFSPSRHQALSNVWLTYATAEGWRGIDPRAKILQ